MPVWVVRTIIFLDSESGEQLFKSRFHALENSHLDFWSWTAELACLYHLILWATFCHPLSAFSSVWTSLWHSAFSVWTSLMILHCPSIFLSWTRGSWSLLVLVLAPETLANSGRSRQWQEVAGPGRVNQCFPIRTDMHFTRRDSPQPVNWFKLFYWLNWCHPFLWSITAQWRAFPLSSPFWAAAVYPGQGQVKEPRHRTQRKTTNRAGPLGTGEATPRCRHTRPPRQRGRRFLATAFINWLKRTHTWPGRPALWKQSVSELRRRTLRVLDHRPAEAGAVRGTDSERFAPIAFKASSEEASSL